MNIIKEDDGERFVAVYDDENDSWDNCLICGRRKSDSFVYAHGTCWERYRWATDLMMGLTNGRDTVMVNRRLIGKEDWII